jgi:hypothetical protein
MLQLSFSPQVSLESQDQIQAQFLEETERVYEDVRLKISIKMFKIQACYMAMFPSHLISGFPFVSILLFGGLAMFQHIWTYEKHPGCDVRPVSVVHLHQLPASRSGRSFWRPSPHSQAAERSPAALSDSMVHRRRRGCRGRRSREASQAFRGDGGGWVGTDGLKKFSLGHGRLVLSNDLSGKELCSRPQEAIEHHLLGEEGVIAKLSKIQGTLFGGEALAMPSSKISSRYRPSA